MHDLGVPVGEQRGLDFFFYADDEIRAHALADALKTEFGYPHCTVTRSKEQWSIIGYTSPQPTLTEMVEDWAEEMCVLADRFNCRFDGWGSPA
jgi:hypothetical protein